MRLFIAEKPSVAKAIAEELGVVSKEEGYYQCRNNDRVSWCFGHMLALAEPDEYLDDSVPKNAKTGKKEWRFEELPIIPKNWLLIPKAEARDQLNIIGKLLKSAETVVNAGDSDREGQLLVDEILEHFCYQKTVLRFWAAAHDAISLQRALANLQDNTQYHGLARAATGRSRADWLIGMNLSRAFTLRARELGTPTLLTVGRVQTPTLAMIVARDMQIAQFQSKAYYQVKAKLEKDGQAFDALLKANEGEGFDEEDRLIDKQVALQIMASCQEQSAHVREYEKEEQRLLQPLAYTLSEITLMASNRYGYSASEVLACCQALYETHKLTSYPRTDCGYLPESQLADASAIMESLRVVNPDLTAAIDSVDISLRSKTWNDKKVSVHYGIIPTQHRGDKTKLSEAEKRIYDLIVRNYLAQFYPAHRFEKTKAVFVIGDYPFETGGRTVLEEGWRALFKHPDKPNDVEQALPLFEKEERLSCQTFTLDECKTKPPVRFTEGTIQRAMENIHKYVELEEHKKYLRDGDGIGTPATRAGILAELQRRGFIEPIGKHIQSTALGRSLIRILPESVKSPVLTAMFERVLKEIEQDAAPLDNFIEKQSQFVVQQIEKIKTMPFQIEVKSGSKPPKKRGKV